MIKKIIICLFSLYFITLSVWSESYIISDVNYFIEGTTKEKHLDKKIKIDKNLVFETEEALQEYIENIKQKYINLRIFDDVDITYTIESQTEDSPFHVALTISISDSKNFVVVPYYKYDSNDGNILKAKLKDSNFLGTLNEMSSDIYFGLNNNSDDLQFSLGASFAYNLPFYLGPVEASWNNDLDTSYTFGKDTPEWKVNTGFFFSLPFNSFALVLNLNQKFVNDFDYEIYKDPMYFGEEVDFSIPIILQNTKLFGNIIYTPSISYIYNWAFHELNIRNDDLLSPELLFSNKVSFSNINWIGNFRKGTSFFIREDTGYNFHINDIVIGFESELQIFHSWKYAGINSRLYGFSYMNKYKPIGYRLRGIRDKEYYSSPLYTDINSTSTSSAVVLNFEVPIHLFNMNFTNYSFLNKLGFEVQLSPFIDAGLSHNRSTGRVFDIRDSYLCGGFEVVVFPHKFKSLHVRGSAGFDLTRILFKDLIDQSWRPDVSPYEIYFGLDLHY